MQTETDRLHIRSLLETDWPEMREIFRDFGRSEYAVYDAPLPTDDEGAKALTKKFAESGLFFPVFLKASGDMLGYVCFHREGDAYDLGYCFHSAYHGHGYAFESCDALIRQFREQSGARVFTAGTAVDNIPSCRLLEKLGFTLASTESVSFDGVFSFLGGKFILNLE